MLEVSNEALKHLADISGKEETNSAIRVAVMGSGGTSCGLGLIIDEVKETDITIEKGAFTIIVDKQLMEYCRNISIDFTDGEPNRCESRSKRGFLLDAENPVNI